jgi:purine-nucleoside phosphorylase
MADSKVVGWPTRITEACRKIREHRMLFPEVAIILGSGLGGLADSIEHATIIPYRDIPHFPISTAQGHAGKLVLGFLAGVPVVAMQGRVHRYEGFSIDEVCFPVRCMQHLGAHTLIASNASGGLNPRYRSGDIMVLDQHINFIGQASVLQPASFVSHSDNDSAVVHSTGDEETRNSDHRSHPREMGVIDRSLNLYDAGLIERAHDHARRAGFTLYQGTYLATLGPTYETRAEYRFFRTIGADVVGMSTVPEIIVGSQLGMRTLALSIVTNVAMPDRPAATNHMEVISWSEIAAPKLRKLVFGMLQELAGPAD